MITPGLPWPLLADFAVRLACGLAALLLATPWRAVPLAFFRTHCHVILGLLVLATLSVAHATSDRLSVSAPAVTAVLAYLASVTWGIGLPRLATWLTLALTATTAALLGLVSTHAPGWPWALDVAERLVSAWLLGSTLSAMLLGHHYLTAPAMSIDPLHRHVRSIAWALGLRATLAALGLTMVGTGPFPAVANDGFGALFLAVRWGLGIVAPALGTYLTWKTVEIRSTQSATGILYIIMIFVLFGELSAMALSRDFGLVL